MEKIEVNGDDAHPLFKWLRSSSDLKGEPIAWNFQKFLLNDEGFVVGTWGAKEEPNLFKGEIEKMI